MSLPSMPVAAVTSVSAETRLTYVLQHFWLAYGPVSELRIGHLGSAADIEMADGTGGFFEAASPYPGPPTYRDWRGAKLPFFFDPTPEAELLQLLPGRAIIGPDLISAAFYLLSGWQEYFSVERDRHGRFPYAASVQQRYGFVTVPVVNYYFDILRAAVEHVTGQPLRPRRWASGSPFAVFVTHDIDELRSGWKAPAKAALKSGRIDRFLALATRRFLHRDAWDNLELVRQAAAKYGAVSTFFLLPNHRPGPGGTPNADYNIRREWPKLARAIGSAEVGLHASLGTARHGGQLKEEEHRLQSLRKGQKAYGIRFHYLQWEPRITPTILDSLGYDYDSTLGFAEHFGFRHSYCLPFYPFNFDQNRSSRFLEIPLNVMDATLHHPLYLQLGPDDILPALQPMLREIERFGGVCTLLWHNDHFDPANTVTGPVQFHGIMEYLRSRGAAFVTGHAIVAAMKQPAPNTGN
ncbi:hypothetical protein F0P96_02220 [Hymenobacter busanensis]|uniref:DUF7033 domain-containing protein n=1 Tax=Hymenobacter busanensis TaxID=2607656 RepID=A0A7L4ZTR3_9BACT|nr:hypothetical protein [Hymenobacter busanensis]KAA9339458.1 hypothetical protein F0P96_02220 [Hymenobacter busanensis]QHJ06784.1 hypothetical protein GUY19_05530 [Hymenobacter busanensis]